MYEFASAVGAIAPAATGLDVGAACGVNAHAVGGAASAGLAVTASGVVKDAAITVATRIFFERSVMQTLSR